MSLPSRSTAITGAAVRFSDEANPGRRLEDFGAGKRRQNLAPVVQRSFKGMKGQHKKASNERRRSQKNAAWRSGCLAKPIWTCRNSTASWFCQVSSNVGQSWNFF